MAKVIETESVAWHQVYLARVRSRLRVETIVLIMLVVAVLTLSLVNLPYWRRTWFDEGSHLLVPKTLVQFGRYAYISSEGFRTYGPTLSVGPTVMLPIALVFKLFGIGLIQARLVMVAYLLLTFVLAYRLTRHLYGSTVALMAGFLLLTSRGVNILEYGRQVLGEVPALFFWLAGVLLWFRPEMKLRRIASGIFFGLAMITKNQIALVIPPTLVVVWGLNALYYRRLRHADFALPLMIALGIYGTWMAILLIFLGDGNLSQNLALLRQASGGALFVFMPQRIQDSLKFLLGLDVFYGLLTPAFIYAVGLSLRRDLEGLKNALLVVFVGLVLGWYAFGSIGWERYAFPGLAVASLFVAKLFYDLIQAARFMEFRDSFSRAFAPLAVALVVLFVLIIGRLLAYYTRAIFFQPDDGPQQMAVYLNTHIRQTALIETWSPELGFLTDHRYHYPPPVILDKVVRAAWLGEPYPPETYDFRAYQPDYLILDHTEMRLIYPTEFVEPGYRLVVSLGGYDLYERNDGS
ncbi:MAG: glycosyl transferase [Chloroflexota bacterium]